jgi:CRISPR-associated protein Csb1
VQYKEWNELVERGAAIRRLRRFQPAGGAGDKLFPPTYPGEGQGKPPPRHVFEFRRNNGIAELCVLIDSVQSQANRLEEALSQLRTQGLISFPVIAVDFSKSNDLADIGRVDTLQAPHRVFDAIIRDAMSSGKPFGQTADGQELIRARPNSAAAIYRLAPATLVFGAWNSTGMGGGLGAKFPRAVVSEIIGVGVATEERNREVVASGQRTGSRIDPLGIRSGVKVVKLPGGDWRIASEKDKGVNPSEINHSNIAPSVMPLGVSVAYVRHSFVLSLPALRRLNFNQKPQANRAAHAALAAIGLVACLGQDQAGYSLRSRCDLVPEPGQSTDFELIAADGTMKSLPLNLKTVCALLKNAVDEAASNGLPMRQEDLVLRPQDKLLELVRKSREQALRGVEERDEQG